MNQFDDALYTRHFLYPLISLYPIQVDLHWVLILMNKELSGESSKSFEELADQRPRWPMKYEKGEGENLPFPLKHLIDYISAYKTRCQTRVKSHDCPFAGECANSETNQYGWCRRYHYAPAGDRGENLPPQLEAFPSAYEIMNHQLEWLMHLTNDTDESLIFLQNVIKESLLRLLKVRDEGKKYETREISPQDLSMESALIDHRINRFCDYILEEIEEICLGVNEPFPALQERVDNAQRYIKNGMNLLVNLDSPRQKLFAPFLANIVAFLEAMDRMLHLFKSGEPKHTEIPGEMLFLLKLPLERQKNQSWVNTFYDFIREKIESEKIKKNPEELFQSRYWSYTAVGPRVLGELYMATINHAFKEFEYFKALLYFRKLKRIFIKPLSAFQRIRLLWRKNNYLGKVTGLKVEASNLLCCYLNQVRLPFLLEEAFGVGVLVMAEMDYHLWQENIKTTNFTWLVVGLLMVSSFAGTYSIIPGKRRFKRAVLLFLQLVTGALLLSLLSCLIFHDKYQLNNLSFLFLVFGSIFFAVVINTFFIRKNKK